jgi:TetR/AcrR family transcriptional repressor of mexJK operon
MFERLAEQGVLKLDDPALAAEHYNWSIMSSPLNRAMLLGEEEALTAADLERYAEAGVRVFLAAYGHR